MRKVLLGISVTLLSLGLVACGTTEENTSSTQEEVEESTEMAEEEDNTEIVEEETEVIEEVSTNSEDIEVFEEYVNQVRPLLSEDIAQFAADYEALRQQSANGEIDDITFAEAILYELLPTGHQIQQDLEAIFPSSELRNTHDILIDMMAKNLLAFTEIAEAVNAGDYSRITSANELLNEARSLERDYIYEIEETAANLGIEF
jgi:hypothetical protein